MAMIGRRQGLRPHAGPQRRRPRAPPPRPQARLPLLRRQGPGHRLQGPAGAQVLHLRARQGRPPPHQRQLRAPPAQGDARDQAGAQHRAPAVHRHGVRRVTHGCQHPRRPPEDLDNSARPASSCASAPATRETTSSRGLAVGATAEVARIEHEKAVALARPRRSRRRRGSIAAKIDGLTIKLTRKVGEDGKLFGSVTRRRSRDAVKAQTGFDDRPEEDAARRGHQAGRRRTPIPVKLVSEVTATLKVEVVAK